MGWKAAFGWTASYVVLRRHYVVQILGPFVWFDIRIPSSLLFNALVKVALLITKRLNVPGSGDQNETQSCWRASFLPRTEAMKESLKRDGRFGSLHMRSDEDK